MTEKGFEEIPGGLQKMIEDIANSGEDTFGVLVLHNPEDGMWSYSTNLNDLNDVVQMLSEISVMIAKDGEDTSIH